MIEHDRRDYDIPPGDTARILAVLYTVGYFAVILPLIWIDMPDGNKDVVLQLVGILSIIETGIVSFFFGGSKAAEVSLKAGVAGRAKADSAIQDIAKAVPAVLPAVLPDTPKTDTIAVPAQNLKVSKNERKRKRP